MPEPVSSLAAVQDGIVREMAELADNLARYEYLVAQGKALARPPEGIRAEENAIPGCSASVWITTELRGGRLRLSADSDALIIRGIVALLLRVLDDRAPAEIAGAELFFLDRTGLRAQLSPVRGNGLAALVDRIRARAAEYALVEVD